MAAGAPACEPLFLQTRQEWRAWLDAHAATAPEVLVGVWKKGTGRPSISWPELVEEALCVGWSAAPPSYRRVATHWVTSAVRAGTRARRLAAVIEHSRAGRRVPQFDPGAGRA